MRALYLAAYDVSDERNLRAMLKTVRAYAVGGQRSVYECFLTPAEEGDLVADAAAIIDEETDRFLLLRLGTGVEVRCLGLALAPDDPPFFYQG